MRKYLTLMSFRVPALILAAVAYGAWHNGLISLAIVAASVPLPWMAVLIANDRPPRRADEPRRFEATQRRTPLFPTAERPALEAPRPPAPDQDSPGYSPGYYRFRRPRLVAVSDQPSDRPFSAHSQVVGTSLHVRGCEIAAAWEL